MKLATIQTAQGNRAVLFHDGAHIDINATDSTLPSSVKAILEAGDEVLKKLFEMRDGGYLLAGTSNGTISRDKNSMKGGNDFWIVKLKDKDKELEKMGGECSGDHALGGHHCACLCPGGHLHLR